MKIRIILSGIAIHLLCVQSGMTQILNKTIKYSIDGKKLTISGEGAMDNFVETTAPWRNSRTTVEEIIIDKGITHIGNNAFLNFSILKKITIPEGVISIGINAFRSCNSLSSITVPESVRTIGGYAFFDCTGLREMTLNNPTPVPIETYRSIFDSEITKVCILMVPVNSVSQYGNATVWKDFQIRALTNPDNDNNPSLLPKDGNTVSVASGRYLIIVGSSTDRLEAENIGKKLKAEYGYSYEMVTVGDHNRVCIASYDEEARAYLELNNWRKKVGIPKDAWIYRK